MEQDLGLEDAGRAMEEAFLHGGMLLRRSMWLVRGLTNKLHGSML